MSGKDEIPHDGKLNTIIGKGSVFLGNIEVTGGLRIDGKVEGNVKADSIFVGREAEVVGDVMTHNAIIGGKIWGNVTTSSLELQSKAELYGDLVTKNLIISEGSILQGHCDMGFKDRIRPSSGGTGQKEKPQSAPMPVAVAGTEELKTEPPTGKGKPSK